LCQPVGTPRICEHQSIRRALIAAFHLSCRGGLRPKSGVRVRELKIELFGLDRSIEPYGDEAEPDTRDAEASSARVRAADRAIRAAAPNAGSYMSECDYFLDDWKRASWGWHWPRLEAVKRRYDPDGLFVVHHGVGSDRWSSDGFSRLG
jgi:hypothetical protein